MNLFGILLLKSRLSRVLGSNSVVEVSVLRDVFGVRSARNERSVLSSLEVLVLLEGSESPLLGDDNLLTSRELVLGTTESFNDVRRVGILGANGDQRLVDLNTGGGSRRLSEG